MENRYSEPVNKIIDNYLSRLKGHLKGLAEKDQEEFLSEIESHIFESFQNSTIENEIDRIFEVLNKLGEPDEVYARRGPETMVKMGKKKKQPLFILGAIVVALFALPMGFGGIGIIIGLLGVLMGLLIAYFATAVSFVVAGFAGLVFGIIRIADPGFLERLIHYSSEFSRYIANPKLEGIATILVSLILAGIGGLMLYGGKFIFKGLTFIVNTSIAKIKEIGKRKNR